MVFDGQRLHHKSSYFNFGNSWKDVVQLPFNTGAGGYNGHRIYGAFTYLAAGEYLIFLDEDNTIEPNHVSSLIKTIKNGNTWAYSLRNIVGEDGNFICHDDCESLGKWESVIQDYLIDVNCFCLPRGIALELSKFWYRRARHPQEQPEVDRLFTHILLQQQNIPFDTTGRYTVNYKAGNTERSVRADFFLNGNKIMAGKCPSGFPWRK